MILQEIYIRFSSSFIFHVDSIRGEKFCIGELYHYILTTYFLTARTKVAHYLPVEKYRPVDISKCITHILRTKIIWQKFAKMSDVIIGHFSWISASWKQIAQEHCSSLFMPNKILVVPTERNEQLNSWKVCIRTSKKELN